MAGKVAPNIVTNGLVLYLDAANPESYISGSTAWNDISRGGNNGTLVNEPTFSSANGGSIVFDGVNDSTSFTASPPISTLEFSINSIISVDTSNVSYMRFVSKGHFGFTPGYLLQRFGESTGLRFSVGIGSSTTTSSTSLFAYTTNTYQSNQPYCLTMVSTGTYLYLYINGIKVGLTKYSNTGGTIENNTDLNYTAISSSLSVISNDRFSIGARSNTVGPTSEYLNGKIFNTQIYNRALSATEVLQNYNATKTRFGL